MLLTIDAGNTNTVFAVYEGERQLGQWRAATDPRRTADEYAVWLTQLMALKGLKAADISAAIIANVVPAALYSLRSLCRSYFSTDPLVVGEANCHLDVAIRLDRPEQVGADRLVNALAAHRRYGGPLIVIDFGTATTFDVVGPDGGYEGGVIAPGIHLSVDALYAAAAKLPRIAIEVPARVIGKSTVPAMQSGVFWGYIGLIEGLVKRIEAEYGRPLKRIGTGGLSTLFMAATDAIETTDSDLTLRGLVAIHKDNAAAAQGGAA